MILGLDMKRITVLVVSCCEKFETDRYRRTKELNPAVADRDFNISVKMFLNKLVYTQKSRYEM